MIDSVERVVLLFLMYHQPYLLVADLETVDASDQKPDCNDPRKMPFY